MNITLEKWKTEDYKDFFAASNDSLLYENMNDTFPKTLEECRKIVKFFSESTDTTEYIRAVKCNGHIIGCIAAFFDADKNAELAYWLSSEYRGRGIMPKLLSDFKTELFSHYDLHRLFARPFVYNLASQRALEKAGFSREGILRQGVHKSNSFIDTVLYVACI